MQRCPTNRYRPSVYQILWEQRHNIYEIFQNIQAEYSRYRRREDEKKLIWCPYQILYNFLSYITI